jgi:hypothetical protein
MNRLVAMEEIEVVGVVKAQPLSLSRQGKSRIKRHFRQVGWRFAWLLFFQRVVQGLGYVLSLLMPATARRLLPAWKIARAGNIAVYQTSDINAEDAIDFVRQCQPDLLVSAYFSQILKADILQIARFGVLINPATKYVVFRASDKRQIKAQLAGNGCSIDKSCNTELALIRSP